MMSLSQTDIYQSLAFNQQCYPEDSNTSHNIPVPVHNDVFVTNKHLPITCFQPAELPRRQKHFTQHPCPSTQWCLCHKQTPTNHLLTTSRVTQKTATLHTTSLSQYTMMSLSQTNTYQPLAFNQLSYPEDSNTSHNIPVPVHNDVFVTNRHLPITCFQPAELPRRQQHFTQHPCPSTQ